jgi:peroxiredoxin
VVQWQKRIEIATNLAILCAFLAVASLAAKRFFEHPAAANASGPQVGASISLPGVDWNKSNSTLVMALSTGCHFCSESAEFYKRLLPSAMHKGIRVLAVLPQPLADSRSYLQKLGLSVPEVLESPLMSVRASGTPTLIMLDRRGRIQKAWVGKLNAEGQAEVLSSLQP